MDLLSQSTKMSDVFMWWWEGLLSWLPASLQKKTKQKSIIECTVNGDQLELHLLDKAGIQRDTLQINLSSNSVDKNAVETWVEPYGHAEVVLKLTNAQCLIKQISMPEGARDNLDEMTKFEVDRQTPFSIDKVYVGYQVNDRRAGNGKDLSVTLAVAPKQVVDTVIEQLSNLSLVITSLSLNDNSNIITIPIAESVTVNPIFTRLNYGLLFLALLLVPIVLYQPVMHYEYMNKTIQTPLNLAKKQAQVVGKLKKTNTLMMERTQFVDNKLVDYRSRLAIIAELAEILPKHTWLEQADVRESRLTVRGESDSASDLVALLTNSGHFSNVRFSAPTTHSEKTGKDRFTIQALIIHQQASDD